MKQKYIVLSKLISQLEERKLKIASIQDVDPLEAVIVRIYKKNNDTFPVLCNNSGRMSAFTFEKGTFVIDIQEIVSLSEKG